MDYNLLSIFGWILLARIFKTKVKDFYLYLQEFEPELFKLITDHAKYLK